MDDTFEFTQAGRRGRVVILHVRGRLDARAAVALMNCGTKVADEGCNLILNLAGVTFIASSGVGTLLALSEVFQEQAGVVRFVELSLSVRTTIELLSLDQMLGIDPDEDSALKVLHAA